MLEFLVGAVGELVLQVILEVLVELGLHLLATPFRSPLNPWFSLVSYVLFGAALGGLSLLPFPLHLVGPHSFRLANLIITPLVVGLLMCAMGAWRARKGDQLLRIDRFFSGYLFALTLAAVRFAFAR